MIRIIALFVAILLVGCGYKPASHYTRSVLGDKIFADVQIDINDPQSGIVSLDALNQAIVAKFGSKLVNKDEADSTISITKASQSFAVLQRDSNGFVVLYRSSVTMSVIVNSAKVKNKLFSVTGFYDFAVSPTLSVLSDSQKSQASKEAALKALDELMARVVLIGK